MRFEGEEAPEQRYGYPFTFCIRWLFDFCPVLGFLAPSCCFMVHPSNHPFEGICSSPRFTGTIVGTEDADPTRWSDSKWRCLKVVLFIFLNSVLMLFSMLKYTISCFF